MNDQSAYGAGWFPDPARRYELRWYNGHAWTGDVSVNGQRYVDPIPASVSGPATPPPMAGPPNGTPSRSLAVLAMIAGLVAVTTAWMPVVVVLGAIAALTGVVLGAIALSRVSSGLASGRGLARAGLALGVVGVALTPIGISLTGRVVDELRLFAEPGPLSVDITTCRVDDGRLDVTGSIVNLDDTVRGYVIILELSDIRGRDDVVQISVDDVEPDRPRQWSTDAPSALDGDLRCSFDVTGPYPFGIRPPERD